MHLDAPILPYLTFVLIWSLTMVFFFFQGKEKGNIYALWVRSHLQTYLFSIGCFIQLHCGKVLFVGLLLLSLCCVGLKTAKIETNVDELWVEGKFEFIFITRKNSSEKQRWKCLLVARGDCLEIRSFSGVRLLVSEDFDRHLVSQWPSNYHLVWSRHFCEACGISAVCWNPPTN